MSRKHMIRDDEMRERVVDLLRCTADQIEIGNHPQHYAPIVDAEYALGLDVRGINHSSPEGRAAVWACADVLGGTGLGGSRDRVQTCLEAALRVELGEWP